MGYQDEDEEQEVSTGKGLRAQLEAALAKLEATESKLAEKEKIEKNATLKSFVESKGLNPKVIDLFPATVDSAEAAEEFVNSYADVFGFAANTPEVQSNNTNSAEANAAMRLQQLANTGSRPSSLDDLTARIQQATTDGKDPLQVLRDSSDLFL